MSAEVQAEPEEIATFLSASISDSASTPGKWTLKMPGTRARELSFASAP